MVPVIEPEVIWTPPTVSEKVVMLNVPPLTVTLPASWSLAA